MSKYLRVGVKEYPTKKCIVVGLKEGRCVYRRRHEGILFGCGVIGIRYKDGSIKQFSTRIPGTPIVDLLYCRDDRKSLVFFDADIEDAWEQVFVYFFDDDGALLLCADKFCVPTLGALFNIVGPADWHILRLQALNIAAIFDEKIFYEIFEIEKNITDESVVIDILSDRAEEFNV